MAEMSNAIPMTTGAAVLPAPTDAAPAVRPSLRRLALQASAWTLLGYGAGQALRLGSNLLLTRLLFPEAFGLMALVNVFIQGLQMFSDLGIGPSIIQHRRGEDPAFLNTAWTIQVIRGGALLVCACIFAWPASIIFGEPMLLQLIPVAGLTALIAGFNSTSLFTLNRRLAIGRLTAINLCAQGASLVVMVALTWLYRSVWALVTAGLVYSLVQMTLSHRVLPGERNRLHWERDAGRALVRFGTWIFIASALTFLAYQGDRLVMGGFFTMAQLGIYTTALFISQAGMDLLQDISGKILFPMYSRMIEEGGQSLRRKMRWARIALMSAALPAFCILVVWGQDVVDLLYDPRYHEAGWILQILAAGAIARAISLTSMPVILACGDSFRHMLLMASRSVMLIAAMAVGGWLGGMRGLVIGVAVTDLLNYPTLAWAVRRHGMWMPGLDAAAAVGAAALVAIGMVLF